jgi:hypothetical protein
VNKYHHLMQCFQIRLGEGNFLYLYNLSANASLEEMLHSKEGKLCYQLTSSQQSLLSPNPTRFVRLAFDGKWSKSAQSVRPFVQSSSCKTWLGEENEQVYLNMTNYVSNIIN